MPTPILMPALSPTMESGTLAKWLKKEGDAVAPGDVIAEIETDKATMEVEAVDEGRLGRILVGEGTEEVAVNAPIAVLLEEGEDASALEGFEVGAAPKVSPKTEAPAPAEPAPQESPTAGGNGAGHGIDDVKARQAAAQHPATPVGSTEAGRVFASPLARRLAEQNGLALDALSGTGPHGRIVKRDIEAALVAGVAPAARSRAGEAPASSPFKPIDPRLVYEAGTYEEVPADNMRKTIARRLAQSFAEVPHFPLTLDCELDALLALRKELNAKSPEGAGAYKLSVNDFVLKAAALALMQVPDANASWAGDAILKHRHADIGVAVAIEGGLITPIVWHAETKGLATISAEVKDLAARARERKLKPEEFQGGTFSVSNLGMYGIASFASIVNQPQGAILSVGAGEERPVVRNGALAIATMMSVTLTCDHRVVDGAVGAAFLAAFKRLVEGPVSMLL